MTGCTVVPLRPESPATHSRLDALPRSRIAAATLGWMITPEGPEAWTTPGPSVSHQHEPCAGPRLTLGGSLFNPERNGEGLNDGGVAGPPAILGDGLFGCRFVYRLWRCQIEYSEHRLHLDIPKPISLLLQVVPHTRYAVRPRIKNSGHVVSREAADGGSPWVPPKLVGQRRAGLPVTQW